MCKSEKMLSVWADGSNVGIFIAFLIERYYFSRYTADKISVNFFSCIIHGMELLIVVVQTNNHPR